MALGGLMNYYFWKFNCIDSELYPEAEHLDMDKLLIFSDQLRELNLKDRNIPVTRSVESIFPKIRINITSSFKVPDFFCCGSVNILSNKLRDLLVTLDSELEFFSVQVLQNMVPLNRQYFAINVLSHAQCIDLKNSNLLVEDDWIDEIDSITFKPVAGGLNDLFVLDLSPIDLIISEHAKLLMQSSSISGCTYVPFNDFSDTWMFGRGPFEH